MPLLEIFANSPDSIASLTLGQIISLSGQGELKDGSECSVEFRSYLRQVDLSRLEAFVQECLVPGSKNGFALQDLINELGRRLGYEVDNGRYQGVQGAVGYDGLWQSIDKYILVVEVKTTDAYRINLDTLVAYRDKLVEAGRILRSDSILIVVGRQDTGDLEAQVRGSKYAWEVRILGVDALVRLCKVKLKTDLETQAKIEQLLVPFEYTRLDRIIDITFAAVQETSEEVPQELIPFEPTITTTSSNNDENGGGQNRSSREEISRARGRMLTALEVRESKSFLRESQAKYRSNDDNIRIVCSVSKVYSDGGLWYAYHRKWDDFLSKVGAGYLCLAVVDGNVGFCIPRATLSEMLSSFWSTGDTSTNGYWHIVIRLTEGRYSLHGRACQFDISKYAIEI